MTNTVTKSKRKRNKPGKAKQLGQAEQQQQQKDTQKQNRKDVTQTLKEAVISFWRHKRYSVHLELGLIAWGRLRADALALNLRSEIVLLEIKSSPADYLADKKWNSYVDYCNRMYFVVSHPTWEKLRPTLQSDLAGTGIGVMVLSPKTGYLYVALKAKWRPMKGVVKKDLVVRMACRAGIYDRNTRRVRRYLDD
jgi:hypothetical protein